MVHVAVRVVEQERGLELQVNCPEFTLATMLPMVMATEPARVREIAARRDTFESSCSEEVKDLKIETACARLESVVIDAVKLVKTETIRDKLESSVIEATKVLEIDT